MIQMLRKMALTSGFALLPGLVTGCDSDPAPTTADVFAEDTLSQMVMSARGDTLLSPEPQPVFVDIPPAARPARPSVVQSSPAVPRDVASAPILTKPGAAPLRQSSLPASQRSFSVAKVVRPRTVLKSRSAASANSPGSGGIVAAGSSLSLVAGERVCASPSRVGDQFTAILSEPVKGTNGVIIPRGSLAVAEITSVGNWGAGIGVRVRSVRFRGTTYPVTSDVGYVAVESSGSKTNTACIPRRARIDAQIKRPVTVVASIER